MIPTQLWYPTLLTIDWLGEGEAKVINLGTGSFQGGEFIDLRPLGINRIEGIFSIQFGRDFVPPVGTYAVTFPTINGQLVKCAWPGGWPSGQSFPLGSGFAFDPGGLNDPNNGHVDNYNMVMMAYAPEIFLPMQTGMGHHHHINEMHPCATPSGYISGKVSYRPVS